MLNVIAICLALYLFATGAEYVFHLVPGMQGPWSRLRYFAGGIGLIVLTVSIIDHAKQDQQPGPPPEKAKEKIQNVSAKSEPSVLWYIHHYSKRYGVDPLLVQAIIQVESRFNPGAKSNRGAMGLMQINGITAKHLGLKNPFDIRENIEGGTRYLQTLLKRHYWDLHLTLASYNAGPATVERFQGMPPYPETRRYVWKVINEYGNLRRLANVFKEMKLMKPRLALPSDRKRAIQTTGKEKSPPT